MRKIFSLFTIAAAMVLSLGSCKNDLKEFTQIDFTRVLTPTALEASVTAAGDVVTFNWSKSKGATDFELEIYTDIEMTAAPAKTVEVAVEDLPVSVKLEADNSYYYRVRGIDATNELEPSNWAVYLDQKTREPKSIKTYAIKSSVNPEVVERGTTSVTLAWTLEEGDTEISHIAVVDGAGTESTFEVANPGTGVTVTDLTPSTFYTLTVHYKSAVRGSVTAWTRPSTEGFTAVADTAAFKQALRDGATQIKVAYSESKYVMGGMDVSGDVVIVGESAADGSKPTIGGGFNASAALRSLRVEDISLDGTKVDANADGTGAMSQQGLVLTVGEKGEFTNIEFVNVNITNYEKGIMTDQKGSTYSGHILLEGVVSSNIIGTGGDNIDLRGGCNVAELTIHNSTFYTGTRTFLRIDKTQTVGSITIENCTFNNLCYDGGALVIGGSNVQGILAVKSQPETFLVKKNLFLNNKCWLVGANKDCFVPTFEGNYVYFSDRGENETYVNSFYTSCKLDGTGARTDISKDVVLANGGDELTEDPCQDSVGEIFNVTSADVLKAKVGDPRWFMPYVEVPEDLTLSVTKAVKTWNFADSKTFYKQADKDMVRDGIRFYVKNNPVVFDGSLSFGGPATLSAGIPTDGGIGFKVDAPGSVVLSTEDNGDAMATVIVSLDSKAKAAAVVGAANQKIVLDGIQDGTETMVYIYPTGAIKLTSLQWSDDIDNGGDNVLATPVLTIDKTLVNEGEDDTVTVSWEAVSKAGSYDVTVNGKTNNVSETSYAIATKSLKADKYTVSVVAKPAASDLTREPSEAATVEFEVAEVLKQLTKETVWDAVYMRAGVEKYGNGTELTSNFVYGNLSFLAGGGKFKFGIDNAGSENEMPRVQLGGTGTAGTKCNIQLMIGGNGTLEVQARSTGDAERAVVVALGTTEVNRQNASVKTEAPAALTFEVTGANAGDILNIFSASSGINIYSIKWTPAPGSEPEKVDLVWDFSSEAW